MPCSPLDHTSTSGENIEIKMGIEIWSRCVGHLNFLSRHIPWQDYICCALAVECESTFPPLPQAASFLATIQIYVFFPYELLFSSNFLSKYRRFENLNSAENFTATKSQRKNKMPRSQVATSIIFFFLFQVLAVWAASNDTFSA